MLVLSRTAAQPGTKPGPRQQIVIGGGITLTLLSVSGSRISLGVEAPQNIEIERAELEEERERNAA